MKKLIAFAAVIAAVSFSSCGNKSAQTDNAVVEEETIVEEVTPEFTEEDIILEEVAPADSTEVASAE